MKFWKPLLIAAVALLMTCAEFNAFAQTEMSTDEYNTVQLICRKLGRGIVNAGFGVLEVPICVLDTNFEEGGLAACTYGVLIGACYFIAREFVGVTEILTFLMPLPGCAMNRNVSGWGYGPIMRPEWIITPETNAYNIFFNTSRTLDY